ncbi:hypothetical protein GQ42DRAFT_159065 [Ramicandelaber brevisporus]|nr:hypothetical protein GQ42DRAFT_159065 [Ramicandelaber brevisporus]
MAMDNAGINLNTSSVVIVASFDLINRAKVGDAIHVIGVPLTDEDYALQKVPKLKSLMKTHELLNWTEMIGFHPGMYVKALGISPTIYMNSHDYIAQIGVQCEGNVDSLELIMSVFDYVVPRSLFGHFKLAMLMSMMSVHAQHSENAHPIGLLILATKSTEHIVGKLVDRALQLSWKQQHQRGQRVSSDCIRVINAFNCDRMPKASEPGTKWYIAHRCSEAAFKAVESGEHIMVVDMIRWTHEAEEAVANHIMVYAMVDHAVNSVEPSRKLFERAAAINVAMTDVAGTILQDYFANIREQQEHQNGQNIAQGWLGLMTMLISASEAHARLQSNSRVTAGDARAAVAMMQASAAAANAVAPRG